MDAVRGCLVVIEGIDGSGKSSLARELASRLSRAQGRWSEVVSTAEPTGGPHGRALRRSFSGTERLTLEEEYRLFVEDRREHVETLILPKLRSGALVICDRYYLSTIAYQGARGMDPEAIRRENEEFAPRPDIALVLELPVEMAIQRITRSRGESPNLFEQADYLQRVAEQFRAISAPFIAKIDATRPLDAMADEAEALILERCAAR